MEKQAFTVRVSKDLYQKARQAAFDRHTSLAKLVTEALESHLKEEEKMTSLTIKDIEKAMRDMVEEALTCSMQEGTRLWLVYDPEKDDIDYTTEHYVSRSLPALSFEMTSYTPDFEESACDTIEEAVEMQLEEMTKECNADDLMKEIEEIAAK